LENVPDSLKIDILKELSIVEVQYKWQMFDLISNYMDEDRMRSQALSTLSTLPTYAAYWPLELDDFTKEEDKVKVAYIKTFQSGIPSDMTRLRDLSHTAQQDVALVYLKALNRRIDEKKTERLPWLDYLDGVDENEEMRQEKNSIERKVNWGVFTTRNF
jgi:hypothetical protein